MTDTMRKQVLNYAETKYGCKAEHPWRSFPDYVVFRHEDNKKWYGLIMNVPRNKLGLPGCEYVNILNVKLDDLYLRDTLTQQDGYFIGYHIAKGNWISILLDGTVPFEEICGWIDVSYKVTASQKKKQKLRQPREWIVPANPKYFDIEHAFDEEDEIIWKQGRGMKTGDTAFMYAAAPVSTILYQCVVTQTDIPYNYEDKNLTITAVMKIKLQKRYNPKQFTFERLKREYGIFAVRGPRSVPNSLSAALKEKSRLCFS